MLSSNTSAKLADPAMKEAIGYWVNQCVKMMAQVKSEKAIKLFLLKKFKSSSPTGINFIYELAQRQFYKLKHGTNQPN